MTRPLVSVTVTCYDLGRYLAEAVDSVFAQTVQDFEILIDDDGSTDPETRRLLDRFERPRTTVYRNEHRGVPGARNFLTERARGEYLCALDADDKLDPRYLEKTLAAVEADPGVTLVSCWVRSFGEEEGVWRQSRADLPALLAECTLLGPSLVRRRAVLEAGGYDERLVQGNEDWDLFIRLAKAGHRAVILPEVLYHHRRRRGSLTDLCTRGQVALDLQRYLFRKHRDAYLEHFAEVLEWKDRDAENLRRGNERVEHEVVALRAELARLAGVPEDPRVAELEADRRWARDYVEELKSSWSWRLTAPLRRLYDLWPRRQDPEEVLLARERSLLDLRQRQRDLYEAKSRLERGVARRRGEVDWGDLRRTTPLSGSWGVDRGGPLDRYYVEAFLDRHRGDVRGRVLEVKDPGYTRMYGDGRVTRSDVLDRDPGNASATLVGDLADPATLPAGAFDCFVLTQTLHLVYDLRAALRQAARALKPGGVLLCTVPSVSRVSYEDEGLEGDFWRFTSASLRRLFAEVFPEDAFEVAAYGNVLACAAFLYGLAPHELTREELDEPDPYFPLIFGVRALQPGGGDRRARAAPAPRQKAVILAYHRVARAPGAVEPEAFRAQMELLRERYEPVALAAVARGAASDRAVAVTFDDGYRESSSHVSGTLVELGVPATFFVVGEALEPGHEHWWDALARMFAAPDLPGDLDVELGGTRLYLPTRGAAERRRAERRAAEVLRRLGPAERGGAIDVLLAWAGPGVPAPTARTLGRQELRDLAGRPGHDIGAHTEHHLSLPAHPPAVRREEMAVGKARLEAVLGRSVDRFAYPFGEHDEICERLARDLGFECAVTVEPGVVSAPTHPWRLPRYEVASGDLEELASRLRAVLG